MTRGLLRGAAIVVGALALMLTVVAPASAESVTVRDRGDERGEMDIWTVKLSHTRKAVATKVRVRDFRRGRQQEIFILYDVRPGRRGFEYGAFIQLRETPRVRLFKARRSGVPDHNVSCPRDKATVSYRRDVLRYVVPRRCLKGPNQVRINVMSARKPVEPILDYAPAEARFTKWVSRG